MLRFDKATYLSLLFKFILFERLIISLSGSDVSVFIEMINIVSVLYYTFVELFIFFSNLLCSIHEKNLI